MNAPDEKKTTHLTIRNVPLRLARTLKAESRRRGKSLNATAIDLLTAATGLHGAPLKRNGLEKLAGGWSAQEGRAFDNTLDEIRRVDPEIWK